MTEDDEFDSRPDKAAMEAAIADILTRLEVQEKRWYRDLYPCWARRWACHSNDRRRPCGWGVTGHCQQAKSFWQRAVFGL